jgi:hypothetical protein
MLLNHDALLSIPIAVPPLHEFGKPLGRRQPEMISVQASGAGTYRRLIVPSRVAAILMVGALLA